MLARTPMEGAAKDTEAPLPAVAHVPVCVVLFVSRARFFLTLHAFKTPQSELSMPARSLSCIPRLRNSRCIGTQSQSQSMCFRGCRRSWTSSTMTSSAGRATRPSTTPSTSGYGVALRGILSALPYCAHFSRALHSAFPRVAPPAVIYLGVLRLPSRLMRCG